ncbi:MAG: hypothetical protein EBQ49_06285, partial [Verrucomicrobia bacterium]|nr:hypothetical protein [Verrucomicrobiota bacterium]
MADPATFGDSRKAAALGAELRFTSKAVKADDALTALEKELAESVALQKESDQEIRKMAEEEILRLTPAVEAARVTLIRSIIPPIQTTLVMRWWKFAPARVAKRPPYLPLNFYARTLALLRKKDGSMNFFLY